MKTSATIEIEHDSKRDEIEDGAGYDEFDELFNELSFTVDDESNHVKISLHRNRVIEVDKAELVKVFRRLFN